MALRVSPPLFFGLIRLDNLRQLQLRSRSCELEQQRNVAVIGKSERVDIGFSDGRGLGHIGPAPSEFLGAVESQEQMTHDNDPNESGRVIH